MDAFFQDWKKHNCLKVPPVSIAARGILFISLHKAKGTLLVLYWPSEDFWSLISSRFAQFVTSCAYYEENTFLEHEENKKSILGSPDWTGHMLACAIDFSNIIE